MKYNGIYKYLAGLGFLPPTTNHRIIPCWIFHFPAKAAPRRFPKEVNSSFELKCHSCRLVETSTNKYCWRKEPPAVQPSRKHPKLQMNQLLTVLEMPILLLHRLWNIECLISQLFKCYFKAVDWILCLSSCWCLSIYSACKIQTFPIFLWLVL